MGRHFVGEGTATAAVGYARQTVGEGAATAAVGDASQTAGAGAGTVGAAGWPTVTAAGAAGTANPQGEPIALSVHHLEKVYNSRGIGGRRGGGSAGAVTRALADVSFDVRAGEFVSIMGASGSGKSTLLNCVSTIDAPTSGQVFVEGTDATRLRGRALTRFRRDRLGFIFQNSNLLDTLTARENIALPLTIARVPAGEVLGRVEETAARLGIREILDKYPYQMSGGQQQRVAAARALVTGPAVAMADEPTGALDSKNARLLLEQLEQLNRDRAATILMVTHDGFAASYTHRVLFIRDGKIFTELRRGDGSRREFFDRIMEVVAMMGGEGSDAL